MATIKQERLKKLISENISNSKAELLKKAGYSESVSKRPSQVFKSNTIQALIKKADNIGITDELCLEAIKKIIKAKSQKATLQAVKFFMSIKYPMTKAKYSEINIDQSKQMTIQIVSNIPNETPDETPNETPNIIQPKPLKE
jgi:hypothetical protein